MRSHAIHWSDVTDVGGSVWRAAIMALREARERRRAVSELRGLDRERLADLGITREQIEDYVSGRLGGFARPRLRVVEGGARRAPYSRVA
ncbi:DUF1127 domain-containing protein [Rubrimonas cliftonensis]|uniref:YjiS-like domain-containing protein n=1 Tax=Rubrimonas cliftonensis TaxID=89524 RepID=A0A1H3VL01_9RHOB|nr:DUF1127 domain-containing protein [Rubrimonas cliftonensis]SDZ75477.1 protein of unknown function [Rubrimonas cliftonensis]